MITISFSLSRSQLFWSLQLFYLNFAMAQKSISIFLFAVHEAFLFFVAHLKTLNNNMACYSPQCLSWMDLLHDQILTPTFHFRISNRADLLHSVMPVRANPINFKSFSTGCCLGWNLAGDLRMHNVLTVIVTLHLLRDRSWPETK